MRCVPWMVMLAHPGIVARMKQNPEKSDQAGAFTLGDLMQLNYLPKVWLAPEEIRHLRSLVRYRMQKIKHRTRQVAVTGNLARTTLASSQRDACLDAALAALVQESETG